MEQDEIRRLMHSSWPRLYLDTGDILDIADGKTDPALVDTLISVMAERGVILVLSRSHFQDLLRLDEASRSRVSTALERFRFLALVLDGPENTELGPVKKSDIGIQLASNIRDILGASVSAPQMQLLSHFQSRMHAVNAQIQRARELEPRLLSNSATDLMVRTFITLARGWRGNDAGSILSFWEHEEGQELRDWERSLILAHLEPLGELLREVGEQFGFDEAQREHLLNAFKATFDSSKQGGTPGQYLAGRLSGAQVRNLTRKPKLSDTVDKLHAMHFPYVDVATCDRSTFADAAKYLTTVSGPRSVRLFRNSQLRDVLDALRTIPNALQAFLDRAT